MESAGSPRLPADSAWACCIRLPYPCDPNQGPCTSCGQLQSLVDVIRGERERAVEECADLRSQLQDEAFRLAE